MIYIYFPVHDYNYGRAFYQDHVYRTPRMSSEYGLQSYPSSETLSMVYEKEDMFYESTLNNHRQHHGNGKYNTLLCLFNLLQLIITE